MSGWWDDFINAQNKIVKDKMDANMVQVFDCEGWRWISQPVDVSGSMTLGWFRFQDQSVMVAQ